MSWNVTCAFFTAGGLQIFVLLHHWWFFQTDADILSQPKWSVNQMHVWNKLTSNGSLGICAGGYHKLINLEAVNSIQFLFFVEVHQHLWNWPREAANSVEKRLSKQTWRKSRLGYIICSLWLGPILLMSLNFRGRVLPYNFWWQTPPFWMAGRDIGFGAAWSQVPLKIEKTWWLDDDVPIASMGLVTLFTHISPRNTPNVGKYTIYGSYG